MTRDIERRDFLALCGLGVLGAQTVMDGASEPAEDSEPVVDWNEYSELVHDPPGEYPPSDFVARDYLGPAHATVRLEAYVQPTGFLSTDSLYDTMVSNEVARLCIAPGGGNVFLSAHWMITDLDVSQTWPDTKLVVNVGLTSVSELHRLDKPTSGYHLIDNAHVIRMSVDLLNVTYRS